MITSIEKAGDLRGKRVLVRLDLNVPLEGRRITDDFRIQKAMTVLEFLRAAGARTIILAHIESDENTLLPVFDSLKQKVEIGFVKDFRSPEGKAALAALQDGGIILHENIRQYPGEKANDAGFSAELAALGDVYVNEGFSVSHRAHASVVGVPALFGAGRRFAGPHFLEEYENLSRALKPAHPFLFILGGAKFETKMPLVRKFLKRADHVFIGGALANDLLKAKGYEVGISVVAEKPLDLTDIIAAPTLMIPYDVVLQDRSVKKADAVLPAEKILDVGPEALAELGRKVASAKCILWNGPLGLYEEGFTEQTEKLAALIAEATVKSGAVSIVGGGDTTAAIAKLGLSEQFTFLSTAGGAMLDFLANETLPGIVALQV